MNQTNKVILAVVLLVIAGGLFFWHFKPRSAAQTEEPQEILLDTKQAKAIQAIFGKVAGGKKWTDPSLWSSAGAAQKFGAAAEKLFTATPSMDNVKVLDFGSNKQNEDAPFVVLGVSTTDVCIQVEFKPKKGSSKPDDLVMDNIFESQVKVKDYKK